MSDDRDHTDEIFAAIAFAIVGFLLGSLFAMFQKHKEERIRHLPDLLEADYYDIHPDRHLEDSRQQARLQTLRRTFIIWAVVASVFACGAMAVWPRSSVGPTGTHESGNTPLAVVFLVIGAISGYATKRSWDNWKRGQASPRERLHPDSIDWERVRVYTIAVPRASGWQPDRAWRFVEHLLSSMGGKLAFQIVADAEGITWQIVDWRIGTDAAVIQQAIHAAYPEADVTVNPFSWRPSQEPFFRYVLRFSQAADFVGPIRYVSDLKDYDPLMPLTQAMSDLRAGERIVYSLFVACFAQFAYEAGEAMVTRSSVHPLQFLHPAGLIDAGMKSVLKQDRVDKYVPSDQNVLREKLNQHLYQALLSVQVDAPTRERVLELSSLDGYIWQFARQPYNAIMWHPEPLPESIVHVTEEDVDRRSSALGRIDAWVANTRRDWQLFRLILEPREIAALWHLPYQGFDAPAIHWLSGRHTPLPAVLEASPESVCLGINRYAGREKPVYLHGDDRAGHMIVFGKTDMGKSTLLHQLVRQDIVAGRGVAVIDPHGNLVHDILQMSIPAEREEEVVIWDLADQEHPPPLNVLAVPTTYDRSQSVALMMTILEKIYPDFGITRMGYYLSKALYTLWAEETPTLQDVGRLFRNQDYRWTLLDRLEDPELDEFWEDFERRTTRDQDELVTPILRRLDAFTGHPILKPILCHPANLDFPALIGQNRIVLVSLQPARGVQLPPHSEQLLGSVLVSQFQMAVMAGAVTQRYYLYVDEAQKFVATPIPEIFNEARKRNLRLTLANQWLRQLAGDTLHAVMGNVGAIVAFQCERADATAIEPYMKPNFTVEDLVHLDKHQAAVFMRSGDSQLPAFSLNTRDVPRAADPEEALATERRIRALSRERYTPKSLEDVQTWLAARYPRKPRAKRGPGGVAFSEPVE